MAIDFQGKYAELRSVRKVNEMIPQARIDTVHRRLAELEMWGHCWRKRHTSRGLYEQEEEEKKEQVV